MAAVIRIDRLSCGIPFCIQTSDESKLLSISVWINGGSVRDPAGIEGLAHLCEHLLLHPLACANSRAHRVLLKTGALVNAFTESEWVVITAHAPCDQSKFLIDLLSALVRDPYCESSGFDAEKEVILQEIHDGEPNSTELLAKIFRESAFPDNPCVQPVGGTPATLGGLSISDVQGYYARFLNATKMLITAHGAASCRDLTAMLDEAFENFPETAVSSESPENDSATAGQFPPEYQPVRIHKEMTNTGLDYGMLAGIGSVPRRDEKYWTALAFEVLMADGIGSLLIQWLRNERRLVYGVVSMTEAFSNWGSQYFLMRLSQDHAEEAARYLGQRWRALPEFVTDDRVEALRNRLSSRALSSLSRLQDRMTLMRDIVLAESGKSGTLEGGLGAIVVRYTRELNSGNLLDYIQQYAAWDRVSLVCAPI